MRRRLFNIIQLLFMLMIVSRGGKGNIFLCSALVGDTLGRL